MTRFLYGREFMLGAAVLAVFVLTTPAQAASQSKNATHAGTVVSVTEICLLTKGKDGKQHSHTLTADAKVTLDGKICSLSDLVKGTKVRVSMQSGDAKGGMRIEAIDKNAMFANTHDGTLAKISGGKFVMLTREQSRKLATDAEVTLDGRAGKLSDLKAGTQVRVRTHSDDASVVTQIEAIEKDASFVAIPEGKLVSITPDSIVMVCKEQSRTLGKDAEVTLDGKACKLADLRAGMTVRVTAHPLNANVATQVEAIGQDGTFAAVPDGKLVKMTFDSFVMSGKEGRNYSHTPATNANVTLDGQACKLSDLKAGMKIRVRTDADDAKVATQIEAIDKHTTFAMVPDGKLVSISADKFVTSPMEESHTLAKDARVTLDGKACKLTGLKAGMKIRVTAHAENPNVVTQVEAINRNATLVTTPDGKFVSTTRDNIVVSGKEHSHVLAKDAKVTLDGKACKMTDLRTGMKIRVTTSVSDKGVATEIEAIQKNLRFS